MTIEFTMFCQMRLGVIDLTTYQKITVCQSMLSESRNVEKR